MQIVRCVSKYAFEGNATATQLSFSKGEIVDCDMNKATNGWVWGKVVRTSQCGWCPSSYLSPEKTPLVSPPASMVPSSPQDNGKNPQIISSNCLCDNDDNGFSGSIMGGTPASQASDETTFQTPSTTSGTVVSAKQERPTRNIFSKLKSNVERTVEAVSTGAQKAGECTQKAFEETKHRVHDMTAKHNQHGTEEMKKSESTRANVGWLQGEKTRTETDQRIVDTGNYAARGCAVGAVTSAIFNPTPSGIARGATRGAVTGGAYGAVHNWKPFG